MSQNYMLCVKLKIDEDKKGKMYEIATGEVDKILKYTTYCYNERELIYTLPEEGNTKYFIQSNLANKTGDNFYLTTKGKGKKMKVLYRADADLFYINKNEIKTLVFEYFKITLDECKRNAIPGYKEDFFKFMIEKFSTNKLLVEIGRRVEERRDPDRQNYDSYFPNKAWIALGYDKQNIDMFLTEICKNFFKKQEVVKYIKDHLKVPLLSEEKIIKREELLKKELESKNQGVFMVRKEIVKNMLMFNVNPKEETKVVVIPSKMTKEEELEYSKEYLKSKQNSSREESLKTERAILIMEEIETLKNEIEENKKFLKCAINDNLRISIININNKTQAEIDKLEYELLMLESNDITFSDAGFEIEKDYGDRSI